MIQSKLYEAQCGDILEECIDFLLRVVKDKEDDVFLRFNGVVLRITPKDTRQQLFEEYKRGLHEASLSSMEQRGEILKVKDIADVIARGIKKLVKEEELLWMHGNSSISSRHSAKHARHSQRHARLSQGTNIRLSDQIDAEIARVDKMMEDQRIER